MSSWPDFLTQGRVSLRKSNNIVTSCESVAELMAFQGQLVDDPNEGGNVGAKLVEFLVLVVDRGSEFGNRCA